MQHQPEKADIPPHEPATPRETRSRRRNRYYQGPVSDHFDGRLFFNPGGANPRNFGALLKWQLTNRPAPWPGTWPSPHAGARPRERVAGDELVVTMVGHATLLIQTASLNILTDPVWSERASPYSFAGPRRVNAPGIAADDLPRIDAVLLSHNHYDHLDLATLAWLVGRDDPLIVTPLGNDTIVRRAAPKARFAVGDWGGAAILGDAVAAHFVPTHHWSARGLRDRRMALWASFVVETPAGTIYHVGDTGFDEGRYIAEVARRFGPFRLACLPIGAYEPRWFMKDHHMMPVEAVRALEISGAGMAVGHHWGTFRLTNEAIDAPCAALEAALAERGHSPDRFPALRPGQVVEVPPA